MDRLPLSGSATARRSPRTSTTSLASNGTSTASVQSNVVVSGTTRPRPISPSPAPSSIVITGSTSRTRLRASNGDLSSRSPATDRASTKGSKDSLKARVERTSEPPVVSTSSTELLDILQSEFSHIRDLITCKICYSLLYEPYTTSCGHTFCYNCFCKTFEVHKPKKCPECRAPLRTAPAPAYTLREITRKIIKKSELLPEGESVEIHNAMVEEHEQLVKKDRDGVQGLFKGLWRPAHASCPMCGAGLQHNVCGSCGHVYNMADELEDQDFEENFTDLTTSEENDQDFDMHDMDHGWDEDLDLPSEAYGDEYQEWLENDYYGFDGPEFSPSRYPAMISRYLSEGSDFGEQMDTLGPWSLGPGAYPEHHGMMSPGRHHRRSYAPSSVSSYHDTEMNTVIEEEEEDDDDEEGSSVQDGASSVDDFTSAEGNATETHSRQSRVSNLPRNTGTSLTGLSNTNSTYSSARSTPAPTQTPVSSTSSTSRRRRRESNTPTSSVGQPRQRRRMGSVIDLTQPSSRASPTTTPRQSSVQPGTEQAPSTNDDSSVSSDDISEQASHHTYVSLDDDMDDDSDGAETTVGWEADPPSNHRSRNNGSLTPTADRPQSSRFQSHVNDAQGSQEHRLHRMSSVIRAVPISDLDENDADDETSSNRIVRNRRSRILRQPSLASMQVDSPIEESDSTDTPTDTPERTQRNGSRQRAVDPNIRSMFHQHYLDIRNNSRTPLMHVDQLRDMNRTPGFGFSRPGTANRHRSTTPSMAQAVGTASPALNRLEYARMLAERESASSEQRRLSGAPSGPSAIEVGSSGQVQEANDSNNLRTQTQANVASPLRSRVQTGQNQFSRQMDSVEQTESRLGSRPPSVLGRRVTTPGATRNNIGSPVHVLAASGANNPFIRTRPSRRQLNAQASTANVRNVPSFSGLRNLATRNNTVPVPHRPPSRTQSRNQHRGLNHTPSMMHLPQAQPSAFVSYGGPSRVTTPHNQMQREQENTSDTAFVGQLRTISQRSDLGSLRRNNANPFLQQSSVRYQNGWANDSVLNTQHVAGLSNTGQYTNTTAPRGLTTRRSRSSLGNQAPPNVIFNTTAGINSTLGAPSSSISTHVGTANNAAPRLVQRRSNRNMGGGFMPASTLHAGAAQPPRISGLRTPVNGGVRAEVRAMSGGPGQTRA